LGVIILFSFVDWCLSLDVLSGGDLFILSFYLLGVVYKFVSDIAKVHSRFRCITVFYCYFVFVSQFEVCSATCQQGQTGSDVRLYHSARAQAGFNWFTIFSKW
jgi:hypothetical protein